MPPIDGKHCPDTAPRSSSICNFIDRATFDQQIKSISVRGHVAGRRIYRGDVGSDESATLPLMVESGLADDFASIAATEPKVEFVSAVAIQQCGSSASILVRVAANRGVSVGVRKAFGNIFSFLRETARKGNNN